MKNLAAKNVKVILLYFNESEIGHRPKAVSWKSVFCVKKEQHISQSTKFDYKFYFLPGS